MNRTSTRLSALGAPPAAPADDPVAAHPRRGTDLRGTPMTPPVGPVSPITGPDEPQPAQQPAGSLAYALLCSRRFVGATMLLGAVIGLAFGLMRPNSYTSSGTLMLRSGAREIATAESTVAGRESQEARPFDFLANEMQILTHRDAFRR